jgi:zinc protease
MFTLALLLFLQAGVPPQGEIVGPYTFRDDQGQTTKVVLKNGLTVIVREEHAVSLASITTHVKAGYFDEEDRLSGISHVLEHMIFKGTSKRSAAEITGETRSLGGILDAYTSYDRTVFYTAVPAANVLAALDIQADALWHSSFDADELKRETEFALEESSRKLDIPSALISEKLYETAFAAHRIKRWSGGTAEGLRALTRDDLVAYYQRYYRPSNIVLTIVGAVDREKVLEGVVKLYGAAENVKTERDVSPSEPPQDGLRYAWRRGPIQESHVAMGFHAPGILSGEARALEVLAAILGAGRSSRLNQILRDQKGLITSGAAGLHAFRDLGFFELDFQANSPIDAATAVLAELENIKRFGVTGEAVARAKAAIAQDYLSRLETVEGVGDNLAYYEALGDWKLSSTYLSDLQQVTPQRVLEAARKYLTFANLSVFEYLPESVERYLSVSEYQAAVLNKVDVAVERRNEPELPVAAQIPQRTEGLVADMVGTIQRRSIVRGPDAYILEDHRLPLVSFGVFFPGGRLLETERNSGITELMLRSALRGTRTFDSGEISRRLENAGARIRVVNEPDFFGYLVDGLAGRMDQALTVLVDILQQPLFDEADVARERSLQLDGIRNLRDNNDAFPVRVFMRGLFGDLPYARSEIGTEAGIGKLTGTELRDWFRNNQRKLVPTIVIVGDTRGTGLLAPIADVLTNEDLEPRDILAMPRQQPAKETGQSVERINRQLTTLVYGFAGVNRSSSDRYALDLLARIVSGRGGRFVDGILEKQGLASMRTTNESNSRGGAVFTYAAFSPGKEDEVRAALDAEYARLRKEGVSSEELKKAIPHAIGAYDLSLQTRQSRVLEYARAIYSGAGVQSVTRYDAAVRAVTPEILKAVMERSLDPAGLRIGIVRGGTP